MLVPAFQIQLNEKIHRSQATIGKYDGKNACLTAATTGGKVFIHNPHEAVIGDEAVSYLNINKPITSVVAGELDPSLKRDLLVVGTSHTLQCYDVHNNKDVFFKEVADGVNVVTMGTLGSLEPSMLALVGGNCSIQGFDAEGNDRLWTVTADNVTAMTLCDIDGDGLQELLVGSEDSDIRCFQHEDVIYELPEADNCIELTSVMKRRFGYGLSNGTIGCYDGYARAWRVKSKHSVCVVTSFDVDGDGVPEHISGWSSGRVEVRRAENGDVLYRDHLTTAVSGVLRADYRNDGMEELIACGEDGEVKGYLPASDSTVTQPLDVDALQQSLTELQQKKQELMYELASYQLSTDKTKTTQTDLLNSIPSSTKVESFITINAETTSCDLVVRTTNQDTIIKGVVVFGEQVFKDESLVMFPKVVDSKVSLPLQPLKDVATTLMIKVLVGARTSSLFHVFELEMELPKFAMYAAMDKAGTKEPESNVTFTVNERVPRLATWLESRFNTKAVVGRQDALEACFLCLRDSTHMVIRATPVGQTSQVCIRCNDMDLSGEIVQDLAAYLALTDLQVSADFPQIFQSFKNVLAKVDQYNATRLKMAAEVADNSNLVKQLVVKAEDARILGEMPAMKRFYRQLYDLNKDLIAEHDKRATNQMELLDALKEVNQMIQRAARLRVGEPSSKVVTACRAAIKSNNVQSLFNVIRVGTAA